MALALSNHFDNRSADLSVAIIGLGTSWSLGDGTPFNARLITSVVDIHANLLTVWPIEAGPEDSLTVLSKDIATQLQHYARQHSVDYLDLNVTRDSKALAAAPFALFYDLKSGLKFAPAVAQDIPAEHVLGVGCTPLEQQEIEAYLSHFERHRKQLSSDHTLNELHKWQQNFSYLLAALAADFTQALADPMALGSALSRLGGLSQQSRLLSASIRQTRTQSPTWPERGNLVETQIQKMQVAIAQQLTDSQLPASARAALRQALRTLRAASGDKPLVSPAKQARINLLKSYSVKPINLGLKTGMLTAGQMPGVAIRPVVPRAAARMPGSSTKAYITQAVLRNAPETKVVAVTPHTLRSLSAITSQSIPLPSSISASGGSVMATVPQLLKTEHVAKSNEPAVAKDRVTPAAQTNLSPPAGRIIPATVEAPVKARMASMAHVADLPAVTETIVITSTDIAIQRVEAYRTAEVKGPLSTVEPATTAPVTPLPVVADAVASTSAIMQKNKAFKTVEIKESPSNDEPRHRENAHQTSDSAKPPTTVDQSATNCDTTPRQPDDPVDTSEAKQSFKQAAEHVCGPDCPIHGNKSAVAADAGREISSDDIFDSPLDDRTAGSAETEPTSAFKAAAEHVCGPDCPIHGDKPTATVDTAREINSDDIFGSSSKDGVPASPQTASSINRKPEGYNV